MKILISAIKLYISINKKVIRFHWTLFDTPALREVDARISYFFYCKLCTSFLHVSSFQMHRLAFNGSFPISHTLVPGTGECVSKCGTSCIAQLKDTVLAVVQLMPKASRRLLCACWFFFAVLSMPWPLIQPSSHFVMFFHCFTQARCLLQTPLYVCCGQALNGVVVLRANERWFLKTIVEVILIQV